MRKLAEHHPERAYQLIEEVTLRLVSELPEATGASGRIELRAYGRAHTLLDDAGILVRQAARVLLGLPAAGPRAEQEMVDQALAAPDGRGPAGRSGCGSSPAGRGRAAVLAEDDVWERAVFRSRQGRPGNWS
ncbi:hypothetical protein ACFW9F_03000 [Streptomyces sp. NPDC059506]|uniref:hypothetical protein n=1 Tax=Streptomyces sp. NPDC059506 TaxID=3347751 RepID=UPI0036B65979